ncbi:hypothetical protein D3C85_1507640 [compost metagenome]
MAFLCRRITDEFAIVDFDDPFCLRRHLRIVGDDNHRMPLIAQLMQDRHHLFARMAVQRSGRFISEQNYGIGDKRSGNGDTLLLSAR